MSRNINYFFVNSAFLRSFAFCLLLFMAAFVFAQGEDPVTETAAPGRQAFFISMLAETIGYSKDTVAYGGGLAIGTGTGSSLGIRFLFATDPEEFYFMEFLFFLRFYLQGVSYSAGPFVQINGGPVLYSLEEPERSGYGGLSAGITAGWRFPLGQYWFAEPALRVGYPYIWGGGISAGFRY